MPSRCGWLAFGLVLLVAAAGPAAAPPRPLTPEGKAKRTQRARLEQRLAGLLQERQFDKSLPLLERIATLDKETLGETHPTTIDSLDRLADGCEILDRFPAAIQARRDVLRLQEKRLGKGHWQATDARVALEHTRRLADMTAEERASVRRAHTWGERVVQSYRQGRASEAVALARKVIETRRKLLGENHPDYASSLNNLGALYRAMGKRDLALPLYLEARDVYRKALGQKHPSYATSTNNLALLYQDLAEHGKALPLLLEALQLRRTLLGAKHPDYASSLNNLGLLYRDLGEHGKALPLYQEAREVYRQTLGKGPEYARSLNNLAMLYLDRAEHGKALPLFLEARDLAAKTLGKRHPDYADSLNNLGLLYQDRGEPGKALPLYLEARDVFRQALGKRHPRYATSLNNLAVLYQAMGEFGKAAPLLQEALEVRRKVLGKKHPEYATSLMTVGWFKQTRGEHDKALAFFLEACEVYRQALGKKHPRYATSLNNLAVLYQAMGKNDKALPLLLEASELEAKVLGKKHPRYATSLNNLALLYKDLGEHGKALPLCLEARELRRKLLGQKHPEYADSLGNLAFLYWEMGKRPESLRSAEEALAVLEGYLDDGFEHLGEQQRTGLLLRVLHNLGVLLSLQEQAGEPAGRRYAAVLRWKGRVSSSRLDRLLLDGPELKEPVQRLLEVRGALTRLGLQTPEPKRHAAWLAEMQSLGDEKVRLEADLVKRSADLRRLRRRQRLSPEQLSKEIPEGVAFVDLLQYRHFDTRKTGKANYEDQTRLLAFVVRRGKSPVAVALGAVKPIEDAVASWRTEVEKPPTSASRQAITRSAQVLRQRVWAPLSKHLEGAKTVIVPPDGALCQFPLAALPGGKPGSFLLEEVALAQVASARQLVELLQPPAKSAKAARGLVALGGVDYGSGKPYEPLPGTTAEAQRCRTLFRDDFPDEPTTLLSGKEASVAAVKRTLAQEKPRYLHLATHGFFDPAERVERLMAGLGSRRDVLSLWWRQTMTLASLPNLRCGLALAGANQASPADDPTALPGVLTGEDLEGLDLRGCEVAVLSACQTALGDLHRSQGVFGLQRSFHAAGVRTTVSSLWSVHDAATLVLMEEFYTRLWGKQKVSRLEALRQAQLAVLRHPERVRKRAEELLAEAKKRGLSEGMLRGVKGRLPSDLPEGGKVEKPPARSPEAWWAAFVLCGDWR